MVCQCDLNLSFWMKAGRCSLVVFQKIWILYYDADREHVGGIFCSCTSCITCVSHTQLHCKSILSKSRSHHKLVALVCLSWHGLIDNVRSPGGVLVEVKHRCDPGEHAQHHHSNTQNIYSQSSFNHVNDFQVAI